MRRVFLSLLVILVFGVAAFSQVNYLNRVPELQETARKSTGGAMGCGKGSVRLITSDGKLRIAPNMDVLHVFGRNVDVAGVLDLLKARVVSNRTKISNPMSGELKSLFHVIFEVVRYAREEASVSLLEHLLNDDNARVKYGAFWVLLDLAKKDETIRKRIMEIKFSEEFKKGQYGQKINLPEWIIFIK